MDGSVLVVALGGVDADGKIPDGDVTDGVLCPHAVKTKRITRIRAIVGTGRMLFVLCVGSRSFKKTSRS